LAAVIAFLFNPLVRFFEVRGLRRRPVVLIFYVGIMSILALVFYKLAWWRLWRRPKPRETCRCTSKGPAESCPFGEKSQKACRILVDHITNPGRNWPQDVLSLMPSFALGVLPILEFVILVPFIGFFLIQEGPRFRDHLLSWVPSRYVEMVVGTDGRNRQLAGQVCSRDVAGSALCGCLAYAGFWAIGLDYALQIALVVGLGNVVPYVGPVLGVFIGGGVAIFQWGTASGVLKVLMVCGIVRFIEDWFIQTIVMRRAVRLHPVLIVFALMAGAKLFGFWGSCLPFRSPAWSKSCWMSLAVVPLAIRICQSTGSARNQPHSAHLRKRSVQR